MIKKGLNLTKCCGVCYYEEDINNIKNFCISKGLHYYYIKHIGSNLKKCGYDKSFDLFSFL